MLYKILRRKIINKFPIIKILKKYKIIIPKILAHIIWPIFKPKKIHYDKKVFFLSTNKYSNPSRDLFAYKHIYNQHEKKILETHLKKNANCIDIGANIGFFSYLFLKISGKDSKIYSFENIPEVFSILKKNFENDKNVICNFGKVGIKEKELVIDKIIDCRVDFIKIDIDGLDYIALKSCEQIIKKDKPNIIIELSEASDREHGVDYNKTIEFLLNNNYKLYEIDHKLDKFDRTLNYREVINIFAKYNTDKL
jgi:hypothetical protein